MPRRTHVMVRNYSGSTKYDREVLLGIIRYATEHRSWQLYMPEAPLLGPSVRPKGWRDNGQIAFVRYEEMFEDLKRGGIPVVNVSSYYTLDTFPCVVNDDRLIGTLVAEHFLDRGFRQFAFCGSSEFLFSRLRMKGFAERIKKAGFTYYDYSPSRYQFTDDWPDWCRQLRRWLQPLPKPLALMGASDTHAWNIMAVLNEMDVLVPDEIAIAGVDDNEVVVNATSPLLSSVRPAAQHIGYRAAALLDKLMQGENPPNSPIMIPPAGMVTRQSSDILAIEDPQIVKAIRFIRENAGEPIKVDDVLEQLTISRRSLERRFAKLLGRTPQAEILRTRLARAKELLAGTDLKAYQVAFRSGFKGVEHFYQVFRRKLGMTPTEYRAQYSRRPDSIQPDTPTSMRTK